MDIPKTDKYLIVGRRLKLDVWLKQYIKMN